MLVFVKMHERGYLYRANRMVNWCPVCHTAISDLEVEHVEVDDTLYSVDYALVGGGHVTVATVRPVTLLGDTAVAVNPRDERYRDLIGRRAIVPLVGREVPIVGDEHVEMDVGTGALKVTPGHDPNDLEIGRRHGLDEIAVIGFDGRMTDAAGERYAGLTTPRTHTRASSPTCASRARCATSSPGATASGTARARATASSRSSRCSGSATCRSSPRPRSPPCARAACASSRRAASASTSTGWSRSAPGASRASCGGAISCRSGTAAAARRSCRSSRRRTARRAIPASSQRDPDVLDTWFSSALWPFATLGWPDDTPRLRAFYPGHALFTARDIINLWVARMIMTGIAFAPGDRSRSRTSSSTRRCWRPMAGACRSRSARASTRSS